MSAFAWKGICFMFQPFTDQEKTHQEDAWVIDAEVPLTISELPLDSELKTY